MPISYINFSLPRLKSWLHHWGQGTWFQHRTQAYWTRFCWNFRIHLQFLLSTNSNKTLVRYDPIKTQVSFSGEQEIWNKTKWERITDPIQSDPLNSSKTCAIWLEQKPMWVSGLLILLFLFSCCVWLLEKSFWKWVFDCLRRRFFSCEYRNQVWIAKFDRKRVWRTRD